MGKTWANVEQIFQNRKINYELKDWLILCYLEGRQFYYSPQTGKWRIKGKRVWQFSQSPEDFIAKAQSYSPPENQSSQSQSRQQKTQRKRKKKKSKKNQKSRKNHYTSSSSDQKRRTGKVDEIRAEFVETFGQDLQQQRERGYKIGWIWYSLLDQFVPTPKEICWLCVVFGYSQWWAFYQIKNLYGQCHREQIFAMIENNRDKWRSYFSNRWGIREESQNQREKRTSRVDRSNGYAFIYRGYLEVLRIDFPFTKEELKSAYRKRALETYPDSGGTASAFREVLPCLPSSFGESMTLDTPWSLTVFDFNY